jgi:DNA-binding Lrp family transcriptional regulator
MSSAFVLLNTELGREEEIIKDLQKFEGIREVYKVYGVYDIIAKVEFDNMDKVKETIAWKLRKLPGVKSTLTMIIMK